MLIQSIKNLQNYFLIATPALKDTWFSQAVIYICEHNNTGAMGIIINKPVKNYTIKTILNNLKIMSAQQHLSIHLNDPVFFGGPLLDDQGFILHTPKKGFGSSINISSTTMITTSKDILKTFGTPDQPQNILVALGYSGWSKGQLEQELLENTWIIVPANEKILFHTPILERWNAAAKILGINMFNITNQSGHA